MQVERSRTIETSHARVARHESSKGVELIAKTTPFTKAFRAGHTTRWRSQGSCNRL